MLASWERLGKGVERGRNQFRFRFWREGERVCRVMKSVEREPSLGLADIRQTDRQSEQCFWQRGSPVRVFAARVPPMRGRVERSL